MEKIKEFVVEHKWWFIGAGVVLLLLLAFGSGFWAMPQKVLYKDKIVEKTVEKLVFKDKIVEKVVYIQAKKEKKKTETTTTKKPDGTEVTHTVEHTDTDTDTTVNKDKVVEKQVFVDRIVEKIVEKEKLVLNQPNWRVGAGVGVNIPYYLGQPEVGVPALRGAVIQLEADRRVIGPFWIGIFGNTQGTVGLTLSGVF